MLRSFLRLLLSSLLLLMFVSGCGKKAAKIDLPKVPVRTGRAVVKDVPFEINTFGKVEAYARVPVKPLVGGVITKIAVQPGTFVKKGDLLLEIDRRPFDAILMQAEAKLAKDKVLAEDLKRQAEMKENLLRSKAVDENSTKTARAQYESQLASVLADQAEVKTAELNVEYCTIRSPIDGRIGDFLIDEGAVVSASAMAVMEVSLLQPIYVAFAPPQSDLPLIREYAARGKIAVEARVPVEAGATGNGELSFIDSEVNPTTGTVKLKAEFPNAKLEFWPGQFVEVTMRLTTEKERVTVPAQAVGVGQAGSYVFVVGADDVARFCKIKTGRKINDEVIVAEGLKGGEKVVIDGLVRLYPGAKVFEAQEANADGKAGSR